MFPGRTKQLAEAHLSTRGDMRTESANRKTLDVLDHPLHDLQRPRRNGVINEGATMDYHLSVFDVCTVPLPHVHLRDRIVGQLVPNLLSGAADQRVGPKLGPPA
jgi:hypothetical protein